MRSIPIHSAKFWLALNALTLCGFAAILSGCSETKVAADPVVVQKAALVNNVEALQPTGYGSISGKVTLDKAAPIPAGLVEQMMKHADKNCCLEGAKDNEKVDLTWVVDPKTKAVANVMVWVAAPKGKEFPIHKKLQKREEKVILDQPHCQFLPRVVAYQPYYKEGGKEIATGQTLVFKNGADCNHNVRVIGNGVDNDGFNVTVVAKSEYTRPKDKDLKPQKLPLEVKCDIHTWMTARVFVFDHPYYALTNEKGEFELPYVPANTELTLMAWHEGVGYALYGKDGEKKVAGVKMKIEDGKKTTFDIVVK
jgi:hypothetical protein